MRVAATLLLLLGSVAVMGMLAGCGGPDRSAAELRLEREDLVAVSRELKRVEGPVAIQLRESERAWPLVVNGLPASARGLRAPARRWRSRQRVPRKSQSHH